MKRRAKQGDWVRIHRIILMPDQRSTNLPEDTRSTPFQMWVNGYLENRTAAVGDDVTIRTAIGRLLAGQLVVVGPRYNHDFGSPQPELLAAADEVRQLTRSQ